MRQRRLSYSGGRPVRYFRYSFIVILYLGAISPVIADRQKVAGIEIDYPEAFERITAGAELERLRRIRSQYGWPATSLALYNAFIPTGMRLTLASGAIEIARIGFESTEPVDLDALARGMIAGQASPSQKKYVTTQSISAVQVTGHEGRRLSLEIEVKGLKGAFEALLIQDTGRHIVWTVGIVFFRRLLAKMFEGGDQSFRKALLDSVRVIEPGGASLQ